MSTRHDCESVSSRLPRARRGAYHSTPPLRRRHARARLPRFGSVILDVDSTVAALEGIDWLAARRGADVAARVAEATERAMRGEIPLDAVYGERLALVRPGRDDLAALAAAYQEAAVPGAAE